MKILISGVCGFAGSHLARYLMESHEGISIVGIDNLARSGSETNRVSLKRLGVQLFHGDIRMASDLETLPITDWVIDAAAQPSVLAGRDGKTSTRQLLEHNLLGTINLLEYCRTSRAGLILLSTSRVYSIPALTQLPLRAESSAFTLDQGRAWPAGLTMAGVGEGFSTENIVLRSSRQRTVPCCITTPSLRVCALPDIFFPLTTTSLIGLNSAFIPNDEREPMTQEQISR